METETITNLSQLNVELFKHEDTRWEKFRSKFPKSTDQEYKNFNPYDIFMNGLEKIANSGKGIDDMFLDFMMMMVCMPLDQVKAVCDFKRRKRQEKSNGVKAQKDFDKVISFMTNGIPVDKGYAMKVLKAHAKSKGFDVREIENLGNEKNSSAMAKYFNDPSSLTDEENKTVRDIVSKMDLKPEELRNMSEEIFEGQLTDQACKEMAKLYGMEFHGDASDLNSVKKFCQEIGKNIQGNPEILTGVQKKMAKREDAFVDTLIDDHLDFVRKELVAMETGKPEDYNEERLEGLLKEIGYNEKGIKLIKEEKGKGKLNLAIVKAEYEKEEKDITSKKAAEAEKIAVSSQKTETKTQTPSQANDKFKKADADMKKGNAPKKANNAFAKAKMMERDPH